MSHVSLFSEKSHDLIIGFAACCNGIQDLIQIQGIFSGHFFRGDDHEIAAQTDILIDKVKR